MPISTTNIISVLQKRKAHGSLALGSLETGARRSVGPEGHVTDRSLDIGVNGANGAEEMFELDEETGRLRYAE